MSDLERREADLAAAEAAQIGGQPTSEQPLEQPDEAHRPLAEAGQGEAEGFELSEAELAERASHGDLHAARRVIEDAQLLADDDDEHERLDAEYGEADEPTNDR